MTDLISIVVPCLNEERVIGETHARVSSVMAGVGDADFEMVFVDDGSGDSTAQILREIAGADPRVRVVRLSRNFGHQIAVTAGLEHASGDAVIIIDADLQDPPEVIAEMIAAWRAGADVAYGERIDRAGETRFKRWSATMFYRFLNRVSKFEIPLDSGDFRLMARHVVEALLAMPERDRFLRGMVAWVGYKQVPVRYSRAARFAGSSKYPLLEMLRFAGDAVLSFSFAPLRVAAWTGFIALAASIYALFAWGPFPFAVLFLGGIQLISLGVIGEYVGRIYGEVKGRPLYFVREKLGFGVRSGNAT